MAESIRGIRSESVQTALPPDGEDRLLSAEKTVATYRNWHDRQYGYKGHVSLGLSALWQPFTIERRVAADYFAATPYLGEPAYDRPLFKDQTNLTETLFGGLAYHVDREVVLSFGNRLTEAGLLTIPDKNGENQRVPLVLAEAPNSSDGKQAVIFSSQGGKTAIDYTALANSLVNVRDLPQALVIKKKSKQAGVTHYDLRYKIPADLSWDQQAHVVDLSFAVKLPPSGRKNALSNFMDFLETTNGRSSQHYQDEAAIVIHLEELIFAVGSSVVLTIDPNTPAEKHAEPDLLQGKKLVGLLSQTAGGLFERSYWQNPQGSDVDLLQKSPSGVVLQQTLSTKIIEQNDMTLRLQTVGGTSEPYHTQTVEEMIQNNHGNKAYELRELRFLSAADGGELLSVAFNTGDDRGIRDLGFASDREERGRFVFRVDGVTGFSYGDFVVSPTQVIGQEQSGQVYYTTVVMTPKFPVDMKRKRIVLHVLHTRDGVYTETQIIPRHMVHPPEFTLP